MIAEIENAIVAQIQAGNPDLRVDVSPERPEDFLGIPDSATSDGTILVGYLGSSFSEFMSMDSNDQEQTATFAVHIVLRNLRTHAGAYECLKNIRLSLNGFAPLVGIFSGFKEALRCTGERFMTRTGNLWFWTQSYEIKLVTNGTES